MMAATVSQRMRRRKPVIQVGEAGVRCSAAALAAVSAARMKGGATIHMMIRVAAPPLKRGGQRGDQLIVRCKHAIWEKRKKSGMAVPAGGKFGLLVYLLGNNGLNGGRGPIEGAYFRV
jgi:hypothetical protein